MNRFVVSPRQCPCIADSTPSTGSKLPVGRSGYWAGNFAISAFAPASEVGDRTRCPAAFQRSLSDVDSWHCNLPFLALHSRRRRGEFSSNNLPLPLTTISPKLPAPTLCDR